MSEETSKKRLGLVLSGGGARGAYEAGIIHYIRTQMPKHIQNRPFDVLCGSSVGAINTCFLASTNHNLEYQGQKIYELWANLSQDQVYRRGFGGLTRLLIRSFAGIMGNIFRRQKNRIRSDNRKIPFTGFLDTSPLYNHLKNDVSWKQISLNVQHGSPKAVSLTATNVHTGKVELFIEKGSTVAYTGRHPAHFVNLEANHAMASSAIPILFPSILLENQYYCDGGLRLNTPLSPAIQLGAEKVLVIGLHHASERAESGLNEEPQSSFFPPTMGEVMGKVLNSIFLDRLEYDLEQMKRINQLIEAAEKLYGPTFLDEFNKMLGEKDARRNVEGHQFKKLEVMKIFPSQDVRCVFSDEALDDLSVKKNLSIMERMLFKILDVDLRRGQEFLSFVMFVPDYIKKLLDLGFEDARARHDDLVKFFTE